MPPKKTKKSKGDVNTSMSTDDGVVEKEDKEEDAMDE